MKKHALLLVAAALVAMLAPGRASAQQLNMDMSWAMRQQMSLQAQGDAYARSVAQAYYNYMLQLRRAGYTFAADGRHRRHSARLHAAFAEHDGRLPCVVHE